MFNNNNFLKNSKSPDEEIEMDNSHDFRDFNTPINPNEIEEQKSILDDNHSSAHFLSDISKHLKTKNSILKTNNDLKENFPTFPKPIQELDSVKEPESADEQINFVLSNSSQVDDFIKENLDFIPILKNPGKGLFSVQRKSTEFNSQQINNNFIRPRQIENPLLKKIQNKLEYSNEIANEEDDLLSKRTLDSHSEKINIIRSKHTPNDFFKQGNLGRLDLIKDPNAGLCSQVDPNYRKRLTKIKSLFQDDSEIQVNKIKTIGNLETFLKKNEARKLSENEKNEFYKQGNLGRLDLIKDPNSGLFSQVDPNYRKPTNKIKSVFQDDPLIIKNKIERIGKREIFFNKIEQDLFLIHERNPFSKEFKDLDKSDTDNDYHNKEELNEELEENNVLKKSIINNEKVKPNTLKLNNKLSEQNVVEKNIGDITNDLLENLHLEKNLDNKLFLYKFNEFLYREKLRINNEFQNPNLDNIIIICNSKNITGIVEDEEFFSCENCFRDYCLTCKKICHINCNGVNKHELKSFLVIEYKSSCHCTHPLNKRKNKQNIVMDCFYIKFFKRFYEIDDLIGKANDKKNKFFRLKIGQIVCSICYINEYYNEDFFEEIEDEYLICECQSKVHLRALWLRLFKFFATINSLLKKRQFSDLKSELKNDLIKYLKIDIQEKKSSDLALLIDYEIAKILCYNLIFNSMIYYSLSDEREMMETLIEKLKQKDNFFYNNEKINMPLTYIFHFYRKYLFLEIGNVDKNNIDVMSLEIRLKKLDQNRKFYTNLCKKNEIGKYFSISLISIIFEKLLELKYFQITNSDGEFISEFLRYFFECYCYTEEEIFILLKYVKKLRFKNNDDKLNFKIRHSIDIIYTIAQNNLIDFHLLNSLRNEKINIGKAKGKNNSVSCKYDVIYKNYLKIIKKLYFYENQDFFEDYLKKLFCIDKIYMTMSHEENREDKKFYGENIMYLNCLHFNFLKKFNFNIKLSNIACDSPISFGVPLNSYFNMQTNNVIHFDKINILNYMEDNIEETFLNKIISDSLPSINLNKIIDFDNFIDYLFYSLINIYKNKEKEKNFEIDISPFFNKTQSIDFGNIYIKNFREEIKYLFYNVFVMCKKFFLNELFNKWNFFLFIILSNEENVDFIIKLRFIDLLLTNIDYLRGFILMDKNKKEKDKTLRFFYLIYKIFIHNTELSVEYDSIIKEKFLDLLLDLYYDGFFREKEKKNFHLIR